MRVIFNEEMKAIASNLERMAELVAKAMNDAGSALLNADLEAAQTVIDKDADLDALEASTIDQCLTLLARQNPVATDLREVVATMRLAATFERMGDLTSHIAQITRRTWLRLLGRIESGNNKHNLPCDGNAMVSNSLNKAAKQNDIN